MHKMDMENLEKCSICLKKYSATVSVQNLDENNVKWFTKLQYIIPELEWFQQYVICKCCTEQLEKCWVFKKLVLSLEKVRRNEMKNIDVCSEIEDTNTRDNWDIEYSNDDEKEIACEICSKIFTTLTRLNQHKLQVHIKEFSENVEESDSLMKSEYFNINHLTCCTCKISFELENDLTYHIENEHKELNREPEFHSNSTALENHKKYFDNSKEINEKSFDTIEEYNSLNFSNYNIHKEVADVPPPIKKRRGRKPLRKFNCEICNQEFDYVKLVLEHCASLHGMNKKVVKPYSCEKCDMRFISSANLDQHRNYHNENRTHMCSLCGKGFKTKSDLTVHEYTHYNRRNYKCSICNKAFNTNKNLRTHNLVVHTDRNLWKYVCTVCEKRFPLKTNYSEHVQRHIGEKKYICHICKKPFINKSELQRHIRMHSNIRAFKCSNCDKEYKERRTYQLHLAKKHGIGNAKITVREKKFVCHICPSQFYDKQKLMRHICSHSGLKPFPCHVCEKKFTDKSYLKHHLKTVHNIVEQLKIEDVQ